MRMRYLLLFFLLVVTLQTMAQVVVTNPGKVAERSLENRANSKVYQGVDKGLDKVEEGIGNLLFGKKKKKEEKEVNTQNSSTNQDNNTPLTKTPSLQTYGKFDFISGEKVVVMEDFAQDEIGDFPDKWNTNSTGELVTIEGKKGKWLSLSKDGSFLPEFITTFPENFTLEFDMMTNTDFSFYSTGLSCILASLNTPKDFIKWKRFIHDPVTGAQIGFHPMNAGSGQGTTLVATYNNTTKQELVNETNTNQFFAKNGTITHVSIWRQKQRLRVYLNEEKVWDLPRALTQGTNYNSLVFMLGSFHQAQDRYFISNLRLAVGAPDTRNKLITEGKFVTTGITFDVNSATIKPESYGTLKAIAQVLQENPTVNVKIIGHTDSDGDDNANNTLSKKRAEAVKITLNKEFSIDTARLQADGKGESQPVADNKTPEGKANNRRVEFVKI